MLSVGFRSRVKKALPRGSGSVVGAMLRLQATDMAQRVHCYTIYVYIYIYLFI